jgi:glutamate synthase domain-containing protein 1
MTETRTPAKRDLYDPQWEHDACGIGAVANISGRRDHAIIEYGNEVLLNLMHRGAAGSDESTGDGAGILFQIPHEFFDEEVARLRFRLPEPRRYGVGMVFGPQDAGLRRRCEDILNGAIEFRGLKVLGWRDVPTDNTCLGDLARAAEPVVRQVFIDGAGLEGAALERQLYLSRKRAERLVAERFGERAEDFYLNSMSCMTLLYKGMFLAPQLFAYYPDLSDDRVVSALAVVHQRYSTNTFPNWRLAQPFRLLAHNGEINTLSGNQNRMRARQRHMVSPLLGDDLSDLFPILTPGASDSACFDNALELLLMAGRSLPHAMMMLIPEAFGSSYHISADKRAFYEFHAATMEPWDGPAAMVFTDGRLVGGTLDRNGLRPARYVVTTDGLMVLASEAGVIDFPVERIKSKGRLQPGKMFLVDTEQGRIVVDNEVKGKITRQKPYRRWLEKNHIELRGLFGVSSAVESDPETIGQRLRAFGFTREELQMILVPMASNSQEPVGSMGTDTPLAVLSDKPKPLFNYFKQLFAQVTNPPIDPLREGLVMSLMAFAGKQRNLLDETPEHCRQLKLPHPILTNDDVERLRAVKRGDFQVATVESLFDPDPDDPGGALQRGIEAMLGAAEAAIRDGASLLIASDRGVSPERAPIPSLLAVGALHHGLLDRGLRAEAGLVIETGEPREVMHFCLLCGYGVNAVNPYLVFEAIHELYRRGEFPGVTDPEQLCDQYVTAVKKGILKTISKMGISTLRSYRAAQLFEAVGLERGVVDAYFKGTTSRIEGADLEVVAREALTRHRNAFGGRLQGVLETDFGGEYHLRLDGERHLWNEGTISHLQHAVRSDDLDAYAKYARLVNDQSRALCTLRGLFEFTPADPVPLEEVEPANEIVKRFCTGAMSHGSISKEVHESLAIGMNRLGAMNNTGEGGEDPARYEPLPNGDSKNSAIKQVASARFGVTTNYLANAKMLQIKMAQGAKPGEGGQLPGHKVTEEIARLRYSTPGVSLISPPPHHDIYATPG